MNEWNDLVQSNYDDQPGAWLERVNRALKMAGLNWHFVDDGKSHNGFTIAQLKNKNTSSAQQAIHEIWGLTCPDCGPDEYAAIAKHVRAIMANVRATAAHERRQVDPSAPAPTAEPPQSPAE